MAESTPVPPVAAHLSPFPSSRHALVIFLLLLCVFAGLPALLGSDAKPGSIEALMPPVFRVFWSLFLTVGPLMAIAGILWPQLWLGVLLEQTGLVALGGAGITYGVAIISFNGQNGFQSGSLVLVFGIFCLARVWQLIRWVNKQTRAGKAIRREARG